MLFWGCLREPGIPLAGNRAESEVGILDAENFKLTVLKEFRILRVLNTEFRILRVVNTEFRILSIQ